MITLSPTPEPIVFTSSPIYQDWGPLPASGGAVYNIHTATLIGAPASITFFIRDVFQIDPYLFYTDYKLRGTQGYIFIQPAPWLEESSYTGQGYPNTGNPPMDITALGLNFNFVPVFKNLTLMPVGYYLFRHTFNIEALNFLGVNTNLSTYRHNFRLVVVNEELYINPNNFTFNHSLGEITPSQSFVIDGFNWTINIPLFLNITSLDSGITYTTTSTHKTASGTGYKTMVLSINNGHFDSLGVGSTSTSLTVNKSVAPFQLLKTCPITINVTSEASLEITPNSFSFTANKWILEPVMQFATISGEATFTIESPPWLIVENGDFNGEDGFLGNISIVPLPTSTMEPGTYTGVILFKYSILGIEQVLSVPVEYVLLGFLTIPYGVNDAFTLDPVSYEFASENVSTYVEIKSTIKYYDFFNLTSKEVELLDKLPLFNGRGKINYGKKIHALMSRFTAINENFFQYNKAELYLDIKEKQLEDNVEIRSFSVPAKKFIAGISENISSSEAFLEVNRYGQRVYNSSSYLANMLLKEGNYVIEILKNNILENSVPLDFSTEGIYFHKIIFDQFNQGDVITLQLKKLFSDVVLDSLKFYVFPEPLYHNQIYWENQFLLQSSFTHGGGYLLKADFESQTQQLYFDLVEVMRIIETKKINKLTVNTGWILKNDHFTIESLLRSKRAWIINGNETIELVPLVKTLTPVDSERELNSFDIEFQINRIFDEKNYSF